MTDADLTRLARMFCLASLSDSNAQAIKAQLEEIYRRGVADGQAAQWRPIETAPSDTAQPVVVRWVDEEGEEQCCFDYTEDGCWMGWHDHVEHVHMIGGHGVNDAPPYEHWMPLPAAPTQKET